MTEPQFRSAARLSTVKVSEIVRISEQARALRSRGNDVIGLGTGEPDFPTPVHVCEAAAEAMQAGETRYPPTLGTVALREAIRAAVHRDCGHEPEIEQVIVGTGAKQVLHNAFMATLDPGDEVVVPAPYWTSYLDMIRLCDGTPVIVPMDADTGWTLQPEALVAAVTPRTRWILLNSPGNPGGTVHTKNDLAVLADALRHHPHVWVVSDEIYQHIAYDDIVPVRAAMPDLADRILTVNGVSKAYAMTGWRIGWGIGPAPLIAAMASVQGQSTSGACSISQAAAVAALEGPQELLAERRSVFRRRRDRVVAALNASPLLTCALPQGAFYVFPNCEAAFGRTTPAGDTIQDDLSFCTHLLQAAGVAVVPGRVFGVSGHFRISYACSQDILDEACRRIGQACDGLV